MLGCVRISEFIKQSFASVCFAGALLVWTSFSAQGDTPSRVVSINLCTDQLAMLLAHDGQLRSVSFLARDPRSSAMTSEAQDYVINYGRAEEIYLMRPDLVLAGAYTARPTVDMLRRLDIPVAVVQPARSMADVQNRILEIGELLGRQLKAKEIVEQFQDDLADLALRTDQRPRAALYSANGWTSGDSSLAGQILYHAGLRNVAPEMGFESGGAMPLEILAMAKPDLVITTTPYDGYSRSEEILQHPLLKHFQKHGARFSMRDSDWVCGTPHVLSAVSRLIEAQQTLDVESR